MRIVIIDNYDSFTYNLVHLVQEITGTKVDVLRNDELQLKDLEKYDRIILSPGPGIPHEAGLLMEIIAAFAGKKSMLGVCLGHQAIAEHFGASLINMRRVLHGVSSNLRLTIPVDSFFQGLDNPIAVGHYHSWVVSTENFPDCLILTSHDEQGHIMSFRHRDYDIFGVQFHPESILTPQGKHMMKNWLENNQF